MHELSICRALLQQVNGIAEEHQADEVKVIRLRIGPLAGIECELLQRAFPLVSHGTAAQFATLEITTTPLTVYCDVCGRSSDVDPNQLACRHCRNCATQLTSGDEMMLESVILGELNETEKRYVH